MLEANETKSKRDRLTLLRISEALEGLGYGGGYRRGAAILQGVAVAPFGIEGADLGAVGVLSLMRALSVRLEPRVRGAGGGDDQGQGSAHVRLCRSRMFFVRAYPRASQEMVFDAHDRACPAVPGCLPARHLRQSLIYGGAVFCHRARSAPFNRLFVTDVWPLPGRTDRILSRRQRDRSRGRWRTSSGSSARSRFFTMPLRLKTHDELGTHSSWTSASPTPPAPSSIRSFKAWTVSQVVRGRASVPGRLSRAVSTASTRSRLRCPKPLPRVRFDSNKYRVAACAVGRPIEFHAYADRHGHPSGRRDRRRAMPGASAAIRASMTRGTTLPVLARSPGDAS